MSTSMSTETMTARPVTWFEVHTGDPERARSFYGEVFGWTFTSEMPGYDLIGMGDAAPIGGGMASTGPAHTPMTVFSVQVPDVSAALEAVVAAGGSIVAPLQEAPNGLAFAYIADPDGSTLGIWTPPSA